jgi:hypothetical protein
LGEATPVTVVLTSEGSVALLDIVGEGVQAVEGKVVRSTADSVVVAVESMRASRRRNFASTGSTVSLPRLYIKQVNVRRPAPLRSALFIVGAATVAVLYFQLFAKIGRQPGEI